MEAILIRHHSEELDQPISLVKVIEESCELIEQNESEVGSDMLLVSGIFVLRTRFDTI